MTSEEQALEQQQTLLRQVSIPAFWAKMASDVGYTPANEDVAARVLHFGDLVVPAVAMYLEKQARARATTTDDVIKEATDTMFMAAGFGGPGSGDPDPSAYMNTPGVRESALGLLNAAATATV